MSSESKRRRVLVTGAGGFIGSHLAADQARRGRHVVALDLDVATVRHLETPGRFELLEGDVADPKIQEHALQEVDTVFHLAAVHRSVRAGEAEYRRVNVEGTRTLAEQARRSGVRRFVHCSSVGVYGRISSPPADESTPCRPELTYERTKLAGERAVMGELAGKGEVEVVVLRPAWVYGPGCPRTEKLLRAIGRSRFLMAGRGDRFRHCVYIRDMVEAFDLAATAPDVDGQVFIIADAAAIRVCDLIRMIADLVGARPPRSVPLWFMRLASWGIETAWALLPGEPPISRRTMSFFTSNTCFDISRARERLGFEPAYDVRRGLGETSAVLALSPSWRVPLPVAPVT